MTAVAGTHRRHDGLVFQGYPGEKRSIKPLARPTPFSFPLMVERLREKLSNESMADRIARMVPQLEKDAGDQQTAPAFMDISQALALGKDTLASPIKRERSPRRRTK